MKKIRERIDKQMTFQELIEVDEKIAEKLIEKGLFCLGCPFASQETIEQGARAHGLNPDELIKELEKELENGKKK